jgi:hypothetical protein
LKKKLKFSILRKLKTEIKFWQTFSRFVQMLELIDEYTGKFESAFIHKGLPESVEELGTKGASRSSTLVPCASQTEMYTWPAHQGFFVFG